MQREVLRACALIAIGLSLAIGFCLTPWGFLGVPAWLFFLWHYDVGTRQTYYNTRRRYYQRFPRRPSGPDGSHDDL